MEIDTDDRVTQNLGSDADHTINLGLVLRIQLSFLAIADARIGRSTHTEPWLCAFGRVSTAAHNLTYAEAPTAVDAGGLFSLSTPSHAAAVFYREAIGDRSENEKSMATDDVLLSEAFVVAEHRYLERVRRELHELDNTTRASFAEDLVATALPGATTNPNWAGHDVDWNGVRIEVKASGAVQSWHDLGSGPTPASWSVPARRAWDPVSNSMAADAARTADVYVLCRHEGTTIDAGWTFFVVSTSTLDALDQGSLRRSTLTRAGISPVTLDRLAHAIEVAVTTIQSQ